MYFRSKVEIRISEELEKRGVTFFANARGRYSLDGSPVAAQYLNGRVEVDFLVFHQGKCVVLQIDGPQHNGDPFGDSGAARGRDYAGEPNYGISRCRSAIRSGVLSWRSLAVVRPSGVSPSMRWWLGLKCSLQDWARGLKRKQNSFV